jgi:hypothetical protein
MATTEDSGTQANRRELIALIGRQTDAGGRELTCGVYLTPTGYEVRAEYADGEVVRTQWAMDTQGARIIAARWVDELGLVRLQQGEGGRGMGEEVVQAPRKQS